MNTEKTTMSARLLGAARTTAVLTGIGLTVLAAGPAFAGHVTLPLDQVDTVAANDTNIYHLTFDDTEMATLEANDFGTGDIDMYVYDQYGHRVDFDDLPDGDPLCIWTPDRTQVFTVDIVNRTNHTIAYQLTSN